MISRKKLRNIALQTSEFLEITINESLVAAEVNCTSHGTPSLPCIIA